MTNTTCRKVVTFTSLAVFVAIYAVYVIYTGLYAYGNPDPLHCYYIDELDTPGKTKANVSAIANDRDITIKAGYPVDMAHLFRTWFLWGFWDKIFQITIIVVFVPMLVCLKKSDDFKLHRVLFYIFQALSCTSSLIWLILGFFWRFSRGGRVASGDKLEKVAGVSDEQWQ